MIYRPVCQDVWDNVEITLVIWVRCKGKYMLTKVLTAQDLKAVVQHIGLTPLMDLMIERLEQALVDFNKATSITPTRDGFEYSVPRTGLIEWMPAMQAGGPAVIKLVGYHPSNPHTYTLPTILSSALMLDTRSGSLMAMLDATFLTALRTGAASAVASRALASRDSRTLGLIGVGAQSVTQTHALSRVFEFEEVLLYDTDKACLDSFDERLSHIGLHKMRVRPVELDQLCTASDIICTSTSVAKGAGPVFPDRGLKPWLHVNAVGSDFSGKTEVPLTLLQRSLVCPDFLPQAEREGECQQLPASAIGPNLAELVQNPDKFASYRDRCTVFDSTGWSLEDYVAVKLLLDLADEHGYGTELAFTNCALDPKSPYAFSADDSDVAGVEADAAEQLSSDRPLRADRTR